jgi:hypothetical protein
MALPEGRIGRSASGQGPPGKLFLGFSAVFFGINHLSVVLGNGLLPEALGIGCWIGVIGGWALFGWRSFDVVWGWARPSMRRELGLGLLTLAIAIGLAEAVAWYAYGQHLWG